MKEHVSRFLVCGVLGAALLASGSASGAGQKWSSPLPDPVTDADFYDGGKPAAAKVELGQALFWDKILSGNGNISCATCHHSLTDTGDGLSLPVGEGGHGLGITRNTGSGNDRIHERVPRNAPPVFNRGAREFVRMFHDGRVEVDPNEPSGFSSPADEKLPKGLDNVLAAQAMFPVTSGTEMAGQPGENTIADAAAKENLAGPNGVWAQLAERLRSIRGYSELFKAAYPELKSSEDITFVHAANAIAAYEAKAFRADNSPFDEFLRGRWRALSPAARRGMMLFYGKAGCADCHTGKFQTDMEFHSIAMPQIGPGKGVQLNDHPGGYDDFGREQITDHPDDHRKFLTPSLRNVALTGPWGHAGAYNTLRAAVEHHLDTDSALKHYDRKQAVLPSRSDLDRIDFVVYDDPPSRYDLAASSELSPMRLKRSEIDSLMDFLHALTDRNSLDIRDATPSSVPSGLPLYD